MHTSVGHSPGLEGGATGDAFGRRTYWDGKDEWALDVAGAHIVCVPCWMTGGESAPVGIVGGTSSCYGCGRWVCVVVGDRQRTRWAVAVIGEGRTDIVGCHGCTRHVRAARWAWGRGTRWEGGRWASQ